MLALITNGLHIIYCERENKLYIVINCYSSSMKSRRLAPPTTDGNREDFILKKVELIK